MLLTLIALSPLALADDWTPSAEEEAVYRALSVRDPVPSCEEVESLATDPVATLLVVVERASMPPWAGMRAAECLTSRHSEAIAEEIKAWVAQEETRGLAYLALNNLDDMPEALALEVASVALAGPLADSAATRIERSEVPSVKALVASP